MTEISKIVSFKTRKKYIGVFGMFIGGTDESTVTFVRYCTGYAIVQEIVAFANFTINFFAPNNNRFFVSKNKCIFSANGSPRSHTSLCS